MGTGKKIVLLVLMVMQSFCSQGLPKNIFDPETLIGLLVGLDPFRYNPPPKSKIKTQGLLSSISEGESFQLGVLLENNPYGAVDVTISSNVSSLSINGNKTTNLKFDTSNYSVEQKITLTAGIDADANNELATITLTATGLDTQTVSVIIADDLAVTLTGTVTTIQEGQTASVGVKLSKKPPVNKTVTITSSNSAITMNGTSSQIIEFTPDNYNIPQTLTLLAVPDSNSTNEAVTLTFAMPGSLDLTYNLSVLDDNSIQVSSFPSALLEGTSQNIGVRFSKILLADNTITVTSNNPAITINGGTSATLNYTTTNGTADQTITLQSVIDANLASESVTLNFTANGMAPLILNIAATDKDIQNMVVTGAIPTLVEGTSSVAGNLQVQLTQDPGGTATITVTSSDTSALTIDPATTFITFDSSNWNTPRNVNINAIEDVNETSETVSVIFNTPGAPLQIYNVITIDNDTRILIGGASNVNEGGANIVTVSLSGNPGIAKTINLVSSNISAATLSLATLTLTPSNYSQSVTISGVQDANILSETVTVTGTCAGLTTGTRNINTVDDDVMNILLSSGTIINEGGTINLTVKLSQDPTTPMTVNLSSSLLGSVSVSPASVSLTSANYNTTGVAVTLTGVEDVNETSEIAVITASAGGVTPVVQNITTVENDTRPMFSGATSVMEGNAGVMFVKLSGDPGTSRTVTLASSLPAITLNPMLLSFDSSNWNNMQAVTVTGVVDANVISEVVTITGTGLITNSTVITAVDTNTMGIQISGNTTVAEAGTSTINVRLSQDPSTPLTVSLTSNTPASVTVSPATLTFNSCNGAGCWDTTQTVTLTGIHDGNATTEPVTITATAGAISTTWNVNTQDDDAVAVFASPTTPLFTVIEETVGAITVKLSGDPGTTREMTITSSDPTKISVITNTLSFNSGNWNIPQAVTLSALADMNVIDETVTITASGVGLGTSSQFVTSKDNDTLAMIVTDVNDNIIPNGNVFNVNEGSSFDIKIKFNFEPPSLVTINFSSPATPAPNNVTLLSFSSPSGIPLTFNSANYSTAKTVTVTAVENEYIDDKNTSVNINPTGGYGTVKSYNVLEKDNDPITTTNLSYFGFGSGYGPRITLLGGQSHILVTTTSPPNENWPSRYACSYDGSNCVASVASSGTTSPFTSIWGTGVVYNTDIAITVKGLVAPATSSISPNASGSHMINIEHDKLNGNRLVVYRNYDNAMMNWWNRVDLTDSAFGVSPSGDGGGIRPNAIIVGNQLIAITLNNNNAYLYNCSIYTFVCTGSVLASGRIVSDASPFYQNIAVDTVNSKMTFFYHSTNQNSMEFVQCNLPLAASPVCTAPATIPGAGTQDGWNFATLYDSINNKIIITGNINNFDAMVYVCNPTMTSCSQNFYSNGFLTGLTTAVIDPFHNKLFFFANAQNAQYKLQLWRCNLDGTGCIRRDLSNATGTIGNGIAPDAVVDTVNKKIYVVTSNQAQGNIVSYWSIPLYIEDP